MNQRLEDFSATMATVQDADEAWAVSVGFFESFGFCGAYYGRRDPDNAMTEQDIRISHGLLDWREAYFGNQDHRHDPLFVHAPRLPRRFLTGTEFLDDYPFLNTGDIAVIRRASDFGYCSGLALKMTGDNKGDIRGWNLVSDLSKADARRLCSDVGGMLYLCATLADLKLSHLPDKPATHLTNREIESLCWLAVGLRTDQIAERMGVRPVTVDLHIRNARIRLGARTREQALAIAIQQGSLSL
ncbi:MAG: LuxR C-terminal-related transcriptional regulator [Alphaproteobacteria bacterium]|nr:LuxR C-terminal-related transcriptional regulator [Alphaproteobacteria bacterium]